MAWITMAIARHTHDFSLSISKVELFQCVWWIYERRWEPNTQEIVFSTDFSES